MPRDATAEPNPVHRLLAGSALRDGYRLSFLANYFTGPVYSGIERDTGLTRPEYVTLFCVSHRDGLAASDISVLAGYPKNSISRGVNLLIRKGLIEKRADPRDGRRASLHATAAGTRLYRATVTGFVAQQERMLGCLSAAERRQLDRLLGKLVDASPGWIDAY